MDPKLSVTTDKEILRLGADVIDLKDASTATFNTDDLGQFKAFVADTTAKAGVALAMFYTADLVELYPADVFNDPRKCDPIATCTMKAHPRLVTLMSANNSTKDIEDFEKLLRTLRKNMGQPGLEILDNIRDLNLARVTKVERKKERGGNYHYLVKRESAGDGDYTPPESIEFSVPLFIGVDLERKLSFDLEFDFKQGDGSVDLMFSLESLNLKEDLELARRDVMAEALSSLGIPAFWGSLKRSIKTDDWARQINKLQI